MLSLVDLALAIIAVEAIVLVLLVGRRGGTGRAALDVIPNLASGACLVMALRTVLSGAAATWTILFLSLSLTAHLADLYRRFIAENR